MTIQRRNFLHRASLGLIALVAAPASAKASEHAGTEPWLEGLNGTHKQYFDVAAHGTGAPLKRAENFLNAYGQAYDLKDDALSVVFGAHGTALSLVLSDGMWSKYQLGAYFSVEDPTTKTHAVRNIFATAGSGSFQPSVIGLQQRGVRFIACRQSIARVSREVADKQGGDAARISRDLVAGLLPGVTPVPAAIVAVNRAQEAGLTYVYLG